MQKLKLTLPIRCKGTIFDVETTGLAPSVGELITIGYISGSKLTVIQRDDRNGSEKDRISAIIKEELTKLPRPYMAFKKSFEERWLGFEIDYDLLDLWRRRKKELAGKVEAMQHEIRTGLRDLVPSLLERFYPVEGIYSAEEDIRKKIRPLWEEYVNSGNEWILLPIMLHNADDLIRSYYLHVWDEFLQKEKLPKKI